jgi:chemotaxis protein MotB
MAIPPRPVRSSRTPPVPPGGAPPAPTTLPVKPPLRIKWGSGRHIDPFDEGNVDSDANWMVSYADMMTLLMSFFAMMFSFSKLDVKEFDEVREKVSKQFGGQFVMPFESVDTAMKVVVDQQKLGDDIRIVHDGAGINIVFKSAIFFDQGSTELRESSRMLLAKIIDVISQTAKGHPIYVEGHTDDSPIATAKYPSNWELSAARASLVVRMFEARGFAKENLNPMGFADSRPLLPNRDAAGAAIPDNQAQNRRVVIRIAKK